MLSFVEVCDQNNVIFNVIPLFVFLPSSDEPYIRLIPRLSPNLYQNGSLVNVKEGENLEISILIEAYPQIKEHWWDVPMSHSHNISTHGETWTAQDNYRSFFSQ